MTASAATRLSYRRVGCHFGRLGGLRIPLGIPSAHSFGGFNSSRACGPARRERSQVCFDADYNLYPPPYSYAGELHEASSILPDEEPDFE